MILFVVDCLEDVANQGLRNAKPFAEPEEVVAPSKGCGIRVVLR